ncbi:MAG: hypothetical protein K2X77_24840 [Candidatus Obscuribacterales bacterium]|nr:hypothetical protein [Candidatus Obscuribacterales bacterium]
MNAPLHGHARVQILTSNKFGLGDGTSSAAPSVLFPPYATKNLGSLGEPSVEGGGEAYVGAGGGGGGGDGDGVYDCTGGVCACG